MDAVKFLLERNRMLTSGFATPIIREKLECEEQAEQIVRTVETWSEEHPHKTRQSEFLARWPNAKMNPFTGTIDVPPCYLDKSFLDECREHTSGCHDCRRKYWLKEVE